MDPVFRNNIILTQTERLMMSNRPANPAYARNKNVLVIGGSGSGKTRFFVLGNLLQCHSSYIVTDPKGDLIVRCGSLLRKKGYRIKVLNTINFKKSMGKQVRELRKNRLRQKEEKVLSASENGISNPMSHRYQRMNIQKDYHAAKAGKATGSAAGKTVQTAVKRTSSAAEKTMEYIGKKKHLTALLALGFLLIFTVQGLSACAPLLQAGITALTMGTYPAEEADVWAAEQYYAEMEWELQDEMQRYGLYHPGYDAYEVDAQEIWHDPYALIALISAYNNGEEWTLDDAIPIMNMLFEWQYEKNETVTSAQKYYTEIAGGKETKVWHTVTTCTVTLKNKNLSHAPVYIMSREKVGLYALYMSTHGNMDGLFHGPHVSELTEPLKYDVPQELLDADPKFALLVEEANKRLGYPYVWGGYTPDTSFDCSGFISWIFTETGVRNIGHMGATGLYGFSQHITEAQLKPGDVIFFSGTIEGEAGITHCGLFVGNGMMVHCGSVRPEGRK